MCFSLGSLQTMTPSAFILRSQRQPVLMPSHSSPKWTLAKVTGNKYHFFESDSRDSGFLNEVPKIM